MKIIDKTPFQNEHGQIDFMGRVQGTLRYGGNWYAETQAQKVVIDQLGLLLEKGFVLIRNFTLPGSEVIVPIILVGVHGVSVIYVTHLKGHYEAQGDQWNRLDQGRSLAASVNLLNRTVRLGRATQVYLDRQNITLPGPVTPVLMAAYPGLQIESMRPVIRVVMSDAIKQFASSLLQNRSALRPEQVYDLADRILTPHEPEPVIPAVPVPGAPAAAPAPSSAPERARAIFDASQTAQPFDPSDLSFALADEEEAPRSPEGLRAGLIESSPAQPLKAPARSRRRLLGMKPGQLGCLGLMALVELCVLAGAGYYYFQYLRP